MSRFSPQTPRRLLIAGIISILACVTIAAVAALFNAERLVRFTYMRKLCSDDEAERRRGLNYLVRHVAGDSPDHPLEPDAPDRLATLAYARRVLADADGECFDTIVRGLSAAGVWGPEFGEDWVRYLIRRIDRGNTDQRASVAVELGKVLWHRRPGCDDPRIEPAIEILLMDEDAGVRLNALSAVAAVPDSKDRASLLSLAADDPEPAIAERHHILSELLERPRAATILPRGVQADPPGGPPDGSSNVLKELARLEAMPTGHADLPLTEEMPDLIRLQTVRVSASSQPDDLLPMLDADQPAMRDLAVLVALDRFTAEQCRALAKELIAGFGDNERMAGAMLGGRVEPDEELMGLLRLRAEKGTDWVVQQHYHLALLMQGESMVGFNPAALLSHRDMPTTTVIAALLHLGRLDGIDWLLNPLGEPPVSLRLLLDQLRYRPILRRYLPEVPDFWLWADADLQEFQVDVLRDWYLLSRPYLSFDAKQKVFYVRDAKNAEGDAEKE